MNTAEWKAAQAFEARAQRAEARAERQVATARRTAVRCSARYARVIQAIRQHQIAVTSYPELRDEADAALWRRLKDGS